MNPFLRPPGRKPAKIIKIGIETPATFRKVGGLSF
jgi:hypothetical protein